MASFKAAQIELDIKWREQWKRAENELKILKAKMKAREKSGAPGEYQGILSQNSELRIAHKVLIEANEKLTTKVNQLTLENLALKKVADELAVALKKQPEPAT